MEESKKIEIIGTSNRYALNKLINNHKEDKEKKKRIITEKWTFEKECFEYSYQVNSLKKILNNIFDYSRLDDVSKIIILWKK